MPEAIILATAQLVTAIADLIRVAMEGQTPEQKAQMWQWYVNDMTAWRKFWGIKD